MKIRTPKLPECPRYLSTEFRWSPDARRFTTEASELQLPPLFFPKEIVIVSAKTAFCETFAQSRRIEAGGEIQSVIYRNEALDLTLVIHND